MIDVYVGEGRVVACRDRCRSDSSPAEHEGLEVHLRALHPRRRWPAERVRYWLSSSLCRPFIMGPVAGLKSWKEARALADGLAPAETGLAGDCATRLEGWPGSNTVVALAVDMITLDRLREAASACALAVKSVRPWWACAVRATREGTDSRELLWCEDTDGCIALGSRDGVYEMALAFKTADRAERDGVQARLRLSHGPADGQLKRYSFNAAAFDAKALGCVSID
jgi:hypothetical protein